MIQSAYFRFEKEFVEENLRCIPMIVRFKLDACGIKLKLEEWSRFTGQERELLALLPCNNRSEILNYRYYLVNLIYDRTNNRPGELPMDGAPSWAMLHQVDPQLQSRATELGKQISLHQWINLSDLQRFALVKLSKPGHEQKNFPKAMIEFGLI